MVSNIQFFLINCYFSVCTGQQSSVLSNGNHSDSYTSSFLYSWVVLQFLFLYCSFLINLAYANGVGPICVVSIKIDLDSNMKLLFWSCFLHLILNDNLCSFLYYLCSYPSVFSHHYSGETPAPHALDDLVLALISEVFMNLSFGLLDSGATITSLNNS